MKFKNEKIPNILCRDEMDSATFNKMMQRGLDEVKAGKAYPVSDVFSELKQKTNEATELYLEECSVSQFYSCIEHILSKIWDNPDDETYDDL